MKKILSVLLACVLALAVMVPCVALSRSADPKGNAPKIGSVIEFGEWPQTQITSHVICAMLNWELSQILPAWVSDVLPDGTAVQYADVNFDHAASARPVYRVVQVGGVNQWYRWEPLQWEAIKYLGYPAMVCTSVVIAAQNDADAITAWLSGQFYQTAFTSAEQAACHCIYVPADGMTNSAAVDAGDYAALYGANGAYYLELPNPLLEMDPHHEYGPVAFDMDAPARGAKGGSSTDVKKGGIRPDVSLYAPARGTDDVIGVRPIMVLSCQERAGGVICCILRWLFGHSH